MDKKFHNAALQLGYARDEFLAHYHTGSDIRRDLAMATLADAAQTLGYTLTPIVTPSPDSGRAKEIGEPQVLSSDTGLEMIGG